MYLNGIEIIFSVIFFFSNDCFLGVVVILWNWLEVMKLMEEFGGMK